MYYNTGFFGMHALWWVFWGILMISMFAFWTPVSRSQWRTIKESPIDILKRRLASGDINEQQYENLKEHLTRDKAQDFPTSPRRAV